MYGIPVNKENYEEFVFKYTEAIILDRELFTFQGDLVTVDIAECIINNISI